MRTIAIGVQDFARLREEHCFYVDKTAFIKEWWESMDSATAIMRPRRFGKTLTMDVVAKFFSVEYQGRGDLFEGLAIWEDEKYRSLQGTYPVIFLSLADVKHKTFEEARRSLQGVIADIFGRYKFLLENDFLDEAEREYFLAVKRRNPSEDYQVALRRLAKHLFDYYGKKPIILLDEYDTPMQEAYVHGYWEDMVSFLRVFFHATFKTNPYM